MFYTFTRLLSRLSGFLSLLSAIALGVLITISVLDALFRNFLDKGLGGTIEYTEAILVGIVYLSVAGAYRSGNHISADIALRYFPKAVQQWCAYLILVVGVSLLAFLSWSVWQGALDSISSNEVRWGAIQVPVWPGKLAMAMGITALFLELLAQVLKGPTASIDVSS